MFFVHFFQIFAVSASLTSLPTATKLEGMISTMRFASGLSDATSSRQAIDDVCDQILAALGEGPCQFACVFASASYRAAWPPLLSRLHDRLHPQVLLGCNGSGIIGGERELEWVPAVSVVAARLPEVKLFPFAVTPAELSASEPGGFWVDKIGVSPEAQPIFLLVADPYTTDPAKLVDELNRTYRTRPILGGLVSGGEKPGEHLLFLGQTVFREGAVGVAMAGNIAMETIVSQGCRPIGRPYVVTKAEDNVVWQLGGRPAIEVLHEVLMSLSSGDRELAQHGSILVGLVIDEMRPRFGTGDFLVRTIVGIDPSTGALAVGEQLRTGQTLQFHLRDAATAHEELRRLLARHTEAAPARAAGGLLFTCQGRGKAFYGTPHHDVRTIQSLNGKVPLGGFFCNGEIGPIGGVNFLHGYTASLGLFRPAQEASTRPGGP